LIENPYFSDEIFMNLIRNDLINIENIDAIYLARSLYQKNYSRQKFKL
jgi:predicted nucleic-acid-binding protein